MLKLESAAKIISENEQHYFDLFEFGIINVTQIYPGSSTFGIYSRPIQHKSRFVTNVPISLYNATSNEYYFGILTIETQSR
jgi:hypothetical protein